MVGHGIKSCVRALGRARGGGNGDEAEIEAGSDEDVTAGGADPIVRALGRARGGGEGDEADIEAGSDEDVSVHVVSCLLLLDLSSLANASRAC